MNEISSPRNPKYRLWLSLLEGKGIKKEGRALLSGSKVIGEIARDRADQIEEILLPPKAPAWPEFSRQTRLSSPLFNSLDVVGTKAPLAVIRIQPLPIWNATQPASGLQLILALSDPNNLGSCLRSAEAFGVHQVILAQECASPFLPRALRTSCGSSLRLKMLTTGPLSSLNRPDLIGLDMTGEDIRSFTWPKDAFLVLGEEGQGLPHPWPGRSLRIPMQAPVESLNATAAATIALFSYRQAF